MEAITRIISAQPLENVSTGDFASAPMIADGLIGAADQPLAKSAYLDGRTKRLLDLVLGTLLLVFLAPAFVATAALIKATSRGPVFFRQRRGGLNGQEFLIWKFRTMRQECAQDASGPVKQACRDDGRVTSVGRLLRRYSIDELPQLLNVLTGEMSLVGPRPHAVSHDAHFSDRVANYTGRFCCRPGITGLAQTSGARGETRTPGDMQQRVNLDLAYIRRASLRTDLAILLRTSWKMFLNTDAY